MGCEDKKVHCGTSVPSSCVPWQNDALTSVDMSDTCDPSIGEVVLKIDEALKLLQDSLDTTKINGDCTAISKEEVVLKSKKWYEITNLIIAAVCELKTRLDNQTSVFNEKITFDISCLGNNPCGFTGNQFTVIEILQLLVLEVCNLKNKS